MSDQATKFLLLGSVFVIATCGLVYELIAGTLASYLLGDSVTQFSTVIGAYLFSMGIGSYLSKFVRRGEARLFVEVQLLIGLLGGCSAALLFLLFAHVGSFRTLLYTLIGIVGMLVGLEIPLLLRILKGRLEFNDLVSKVFAFDYIGALLASVLFPLVLVPKLGLVRSAFLFGMLNVVVGLGTLRLLGGQSMRARSTAVLGVLLLGGLFAGFLASDRLLSISEKSAYVDNVIYATSSPYQRIVLTRSGSDLRLHLNGNLQFSSRDEYRYHEALVHPALARLPQAESVLVLGGGDGLAVREVLRYPGIRRVVLVDLDPVMTKLFAAQPLLTRLNAGSLSDGRVRIDNADAFVWLAEKASAKQGTVPEELRRFDCIIADFPDPSNFSIGKLYTTAFFEHVRSVLKPGGIFAVQCTSPYVARRSFWCIDETLRAVGFSTAPYHLYVPSFGEWGFIMAHQGILGEPSRLPEGLRFLTEATLGDLFRFPPDMDRIPTEINRLNNQVLVRYFDEEWAGYVH